MNEKQSISAAETEILRILWKCEKPMKVQEICDKLPEKNWAYKTIATLLTRLEEKGAVKSEKNGKAKYYVSLIDKEEYRKEKTENLIHSLYDNSVKDLAVALFKSGSMTQEDIEDIRRMFNL